ncbi:MAG: hypothetical protein L6Q37_11600 [Bdellovibrionaceae bacterium]|nr:hypothetical protein [Pseudobdellovibrionaceae bacterium]NUM59587.1 hypothetical protein [Pseudobdellovibrionaceae bacterium]
MSLSGKNLTLELCQHSEIDQSLFKNEFNDILQNYRLNPETFTLDELREALADYVQELILEMTKDS